jgi:enoyl-CoA hydratase
VSDSTVIVERAGDRVVARLNRPEVRNAVNRDMVDALHALCAELERDPRILIITGEGDQFAAGADIAELRERGRHDALLGINSTLFDRVRRLPMPTIALVNGAAIGGGAELAYACDFRLGTDQTRFANPEPALGIVAAAGACWRLAALVGEPLAKEVLLAGRTLDASAARACGLLNEVVERADLSDAGHRLADRISSQVPLAVRLTKASLHAPSDAHPLVDDLVQAVLFETEEKTQRMTSFLERKAARS